MATINRLPTSEFLSTNWTNAGSIAAALTDGNLTTGTSNPNLAEDLLMEFSDIGSPVPSVSPIVSVTLHTGWNNPSAGADGTAKIRGRLGTAHTLTDGATHSPGAGTSTLDYTGFGPLLTTVAAFNASQFGCTEVNYIVNPLQFTTLNADIVYTVIGGGMIFLIGSLGPLIAVGLEQIPALAREIFRRTGSRLDRAEHAALFREIREWRYPKYFFIGGRP